MPDDTIYAISSGRPPAAIAVMRISGPRAGDVLARLAGGSPAPRMATLRTLRSSTGDMLDRALTLWFPGPASATGEDVAELHLHGGIAIVDAVSAALAEIGLRRAEPGEFTRRAVLNGRLDLNEAEGLADLLAAETESQRREALLRATGVFGRDLAGWSDRLLAMIAIVERAIDYDDADDADPIREIAEPLLRLRDDISSALSRPAAERLRDGIRVAIVGPVNAGKSSLFNALLGADAAIVTPIAGTTRDVLERSVAMAGIPFLLMDTAGLRETDDAVERIGIERAHRAAAGADFTLDLADDAIESDRRIPIAAKADLGVTFSNRLDVSAKTGEGIDALWESLSHRAASLLPADGEIAITARHRIELDRIQAFLSEALRGGDLLLMADHLASAARSLDRLTGRAGLDDILDVLFSRFCLGK